MLRLLRALPLPLAAAAAFAAAASAAAADPATVAAQGGPAPAPAPKPAGERIAYDFSSETQLADFDARAGSWSISAGTLWCTSKGAREELRWRRPLSPHGSLSLKLVGPGHVAIALGAGPRSARLRIDRSAGRWFVELDDKPLLERAFEAKPTGPLALELSWAQEGIVVRVGDDDPQSAPLAGLKEPFDSLALLSLRSQPRFDDFVVARADAPKAAPPAPGEAPALDENQKIAVERAAALLDGGDAVGAFELLAKSLPPVKAGAPPKLAAPLLQLLQRIALADQKSGRLRGREPLQSLLAAREVAAKDGSAALLLPLDGRFTAQPAEIHRTDGPVFTVTGKDPELSIEVFRYAGELKYWFGKDPKIVYCSGSGGPALARARADEQRELVPKSEMKVEVGKAKAPLGGETCWSYELLRPDAAHDGRIVALRELFVLHKGDTWRFTITGPPPALELAADDLEFVRASFRFER
jgi:hypothetical protein